MQKTYRHPSDVLESVIGRLLDERPCLVAFSGGCDSSLVLSAATAACRVVGHDDPIPVTYRYPTEEAHEDAYQESVVRWLGLREWCKFDLGAEADFLSPTTCAALVEHGPMWPPAPLTRAHVLARLGGGLWLTGEGGDEVLGPRRSSYAVRAVRASIRGPFHPPAAVWRRTIEELAPNPLRMRWTVDRLLRDSRAEWLDEDLDRRYVRVAASVAAAEPLRPGRWFDYYLSRPTVQIGHASLRSFKARHDLQWEAPLVDREFLGALKSWLRWHEYRGRRHLLRTVFSNLPKDLIERRTKASFNTALFGTYTREFAEAWNGAGAPDGVDGEWLKQHWSSADVSARTAPLLHHVWLTAHERSNSHIPRWV